MLNNFRSSNCRFVIFFDSVYFSFNFRFSIASSHKIFRNSIYKHITFFRKKQKQTIGMCFYTTKINLPTSLFFYILQVLLFSRKRKAAKIFFTKILINISAMKQHFVKTSALTLALFATIIGTTTDANAQTERNSRTTIEEPAEKPQRIVKEHKIQHPKKIKQSVKPTQTGKTRTKPTFATEKPQTKPTTTEKDEEIYTIVAQMPEFVGGKAEMFKFIDENLVYPPMAKDNGIEGTVFVSFVVFQDGSIHDAIVRRGVPGGGAGCDAEALRVVNAMPNWNGGMHDGKRVKVSFTLPIKFKL